MTIHKRHAAYIGWMAGLLTILLLIAMPPELPPDDVAIWIACVSLTAFMLNFGLSFSEGEISAAHSASIMTYLVLSSSGDALWAVTIGVLVGVLIREAKRHYWQDWTIFARDVWQPAARTIGQLTLSLAIGGWFYERLDGDLPLTHFQSSDLLPLAGFVAVYLSVHLTLLVIQMRSIQRGRRLRETLLLNWQSLTTILLIPMPIAILSAVVYHAISPLAFTMMIIGLAIIALGIYGLSHTQHRYEQQVRNLSTLANISNAMRTNLSLEILLQTLYLQIASLLDVHNVTVALYDPMRENIFFPLHTRRGESESLMEVHMESEHPASKPTRQIPKYIIENATDLGIIPSKLPRACWIGVPILTSDQTTGAIFIASDNDDRPFTSQEQQLLATIAAQSGVALDNAQLYQQADERARQLQTLTRVGTQMSSILNDERVLTQIVKYVMEVMIADAAAIYLWEDESHQNLKLIRHSGLSQAFVDDPPQPMTATTLENRLLPVLITDSHQYEHAEPWRQILDDEHKRAWIEMPLRYGQDVMGVLVVYFDVPQRYSDEDMEVLQSFANQAVLAIRNAQLYSQTDATLRRRVEQLSLLESLGQELFSARVQIDTIFMQVLRSAITGTSAQAGTLVLREHKDSTPKPVATLGYSDAMPTEQLLEGISEYVLEKAEAILISDTKLDTRFTPALPTSRALLSVPILQGVTVIGVITLESNQPKGFGHEDMIFVMQVGAQVRIAIDNARLISNIEATRDRLQTILDSMTEAILLIDTDSYIRLANPRVKTLLSLEPEAIIERSVYDLLDDSTFAPSLGFDLVSLRGICAKLATGDWQPDNERHVYTHALDGQRRFLERTDVAVYDQYGEVIGWLMVFVDVTEERELTQARDDLYHMIVHDLRSPLTAINASLRLINSVASTDSETGEIIEQTTDTAVRAVRKLLNLVNSLLDISKMESGTMALEREPTGARQIAIDVHEELQPLAEQMEVEVINNIAPHLPLLNVDPEKIERVLLNLVDNAIKFTPSKGQVQIEAQVETDTHLLIQVIDNGPGIPDDFKKRLFDRFVQVEGQSGRRRGTGLGLTFCRLAVEAHGGQIWVEDNPPGGSIFCFTLPTLDM